MTWGAMERLRPGQIDAIRKRTPLAYLPWGALEWHSLHNPVGLDGLAARALSEALARKTGGVVLPPVYAGTDTIKTLHPFGHTLEHREGTIRILCREYLEELADGGWKVLVVVMGHVGGAHVRAVRETAAAFAKRHPRLRVWAMPAPEPLEGAFRGDHAAVNETSLQMLTHPTLVDLKRLPKGRPLTLPKDGIWGQDPRKATAARGRRIRAAFLRKAVPRVRKLLRETA